MSLRLCKQHLTLDTVRRGELGSPASPSSRRIVPHQSRSTNTGGSGLHPRPHPSSTPPPPICNRSAGPVGSSGIHLELVHISLSPVPLLFQVSLTSHLSHVIASSPSCSCFPRIQCLHSSKLTSLLLLKILWQLPMAHSLMPHHGPQALRVCTLGSADPQAVQRQDSQDL